MDENDSMSKEYTKDNAEMNSDNEFYSDSDIRQKRYYVKFQNNTNSQCIRSKPYGRNKSAGKQRL